MNEATYMIGTTRESSKQIVPDSPTTAALTAELRWLCLEQEMGRIMTTEGIELPVISSGTFVGSLNCSDKYPRPHSRLAYPAITLCALLILKKDKWCTILDSRMSTCAQVGRREKSSPHLKGLHALLGRSILVQVNDLCVSLVTARALRDPQGFQKHMASI